MSVFAGEQGGLFAALKNIVATLLASGRTRLELLANEIAEEKLHLVRLLLLALGMMFFLAMGLLVLLAFLAVLFWESRLLVLGLGSGFFLLIGFVLYGSFNKAMQRPEQLFAASLAELQEDLRHLKAEDAAVE